MRQQIPAGGGAQRTRIKVVPPSPPARRRVHPLDAWEQAMVEEGVEDATVWSNTSRRLRLLILLCVGVELVVAGLIVWLLW